MTATAIILLTLSSHWNTLRYEPVETAGSIAVLMLGNKTYSTHVPAASIQARNSLSSDSFRWTNAGIFSTSSISSFIGTNL